jgi:hypothetical protein
VFDVTPPRYTRFPESPRIWSLYDLFASRNVVPRSIAPSSVKKSLPKVNDFDILQRLKRRWKYILGGFLLCVLLVVGAVWYFLARGSLSNGTLSLISLTNTVAGPIAKLEIVDPWYLTKTDMIGSVPSYKIYVFRHGKWSEAPDAVSRINWEAHLHRGTRAMRRGNSFIVQVPVCKKWKLEFSQSERRKFRSKWLPFTFSIAARWDSAELPGWSEISQGFNALDK